ncbi:MAG: glycogen synthase GlgA [Acidobacteria bacterium]|nr:glycogen synthase GlgA [Acidobacteriota bacterium]
MAAEIWMASAEARPLAQTGGLADVLRALPDALARRGHGVRRFLPAYGFIDRSGFAPESPDLSVPVGAAHVPARFLSRKEGSGVVTTLVENQELLGRDDLYGPPGSDYPDNARRFTFFARAVFEWARRRERGPDILHAHDWHAALIPLFCRLLPGDQPVPRTILTIHNLGYQGHFAASELDHLSLPEPARSAAYRVEGLEFHGGINFLKAGIVYSDALTTVSPTYAKEILTPEFGCGLDGLLRWQIPKLCGILNGADYDLWDPPRDTALPEQYGPESLQRKAASTRALRERFGLPPGDRPILGVVSRLVYQKGIDLVAEAAEALLQAGADLVILGSGEPDIVDRLETLRARHPQRVALYIGYNETLSHLVVAGSDLLLIPSRYEPCGLTQMYAMRYGTPPVVTHTGGLSDTVRDASGGDEGTGFFLDHFSAGALVKAVRRALELRRVDPEAWKRLQRNAMAANFSWEAAASSYSELYHQILR